MCTGVGVGAKLRGSPRFLGVKSGFLDLNFSKIWAIEVVSRCLKRDATSHIFPGIIFWNSNL